MDCGVVDVVAGVEVKKVGVEDAAAEKALEGAEGVVDVVEGVGVKRVGVEDAAA